MPSKKIGLAGNATGTNKNRNKKDSNNNSRETLSGVVSAQRSLRSRGKITEAAFSEILASPEVNGKKIPDGKKIGGGFGRFESSEGRSYAVILGHFSPKRASRLKKIYTEKENYLSEYQLGTPTKERKLTHLWTPKHTRKMQLRHKRASAKPFNRLN